MSSVGERIGKKTVFCIFWWQFFSLVDFLFSVGQGFIAQICHSQIAQVLWLCFDFLWSSFLSRNRLNKKVTMNAFRNKMDYGSSKGVRARTKVQETQIYNLTFLYIYCR